MTTEEKTRKPALSWVQVSAAALAAMSSAVLLSTLGVAGTIVGAAIGSVTASLAGSLYHRGIDASRQQVVTHTSALRRVSQARVRLRDAAAVAQADGDEDLVDEAQRELDEAESDLARSSDETGVPETLPLARRVPWKRVAIVAGSVFVTVMVAITVFELVAGRPLSTYTGGTDARSGTTVPGLGASEDDTTTPTPTDSATPTATSASESPTASASPNDTATTSETPTPTESVSPTDIATLPTSEEPTPTETLTPEVVP